MKNLLLILGAIMLLSPIAQEAKAELPFPPNGVGLLLGYDDHKLNDGDLTGPTVGLKYAYVFDSAPIFFAGAHAYYSSLEYEQGAVKEDATNISAGLLAGIMIPVLDKNLGPPLYITYNPYENLSFDDRDVDITGSSLKVTFQLPIPPMFSIDISYAKFFYDDADRPSFVAGDGLDRDGMTYTFQIAYTW